ncbi:tyrosine-type recombinase/integrase [Bacillus sp. B15-48]|uniref:tyrosine-type recombinase/integrase n=1 Tax=Bacillus sp. B15-48 TaxID=1548601 RepID=UPI00193FA0FF|nr:tyrosine-type recombinase/integrase [Bacillus sp. B15-48]MBM4762750.1 tyrosine-type recombinase/integrase [Bacillus sp. B15-48]
MASIEKRGKNSYRLSVVIGYESDGTPIRERKTVKAKNPTEARKLLTLFEAEILQGQYVQIEEKMTLSRFFEKEWLEKYANDSNNLTPDTRQNYINIMEKRVLPKYGHMKLADLKTIHIVNFMNDLKKDGKRLDGKEGSLSPSTIANCYRAFNNVLSRAAEWKLIKENPAVGVKPPKVRIKKSDVYSDEEVSKLLSCLEEKPFHWKVLILLAIATGAREGEIAALEWKHIDFEKGTIDIEQSLTEVVGEGVRLKTTKNERNRKVSIPDHVVAMLKKLKIQRSHEKLLVGDMNQWPNHFFIFANEFGKPIRPDSISQWWKRFTTKYKLRHIRFHELRHTSATFLINAGVHPKVIQERLGHADISTTMNVYGHVLYEADQAAANHFDSFFSKKGSEK